MRRVILLLTAMVAMVVLYAGAALAESQLDQQQTNYDSSIQYDIVSNSQNIAQTFTPGVSGSLDKVSVFIREVRSCGAELDDCPPDPSLISAGDLVAEVRTVDGSGRPTETVLGTGSVPDTFTLNAINWVDIPLSQPAEVSAGTQYALVLRAPSAVYADYGWLFDSTNPYPGGYAWETNPYLGWFPSEGYDLAFKTYVSAPVLYDFQGFYSPVDNLDVATNKVKAGSSIPVKFSLGGDQGLDIFATGTDADNNAFAYPTSTAMACDSTDQWDAIEETETAGGSSLQYDPSLEQYTYVWKTNKAWAGTCRQLVVKLDDGTYHRANFKFVK